MGVKTPSEAKNSVYEYIFSICGIKIKSILFSKHIGTYLILYEQKSQQYYYCQLL
ncbi:hypothetical protein HYH54_12215 [Clostridium botulinum]|nr:hypothetical protein [Clostridium botulinum]